MTVWLPPGVLSAPRLSYMTSISNEVLCRMSHQTEQSLMMRDLVASSNLISVGYDAANSDT